MTAQRMGQAWSVHWAEVLAVLATMPDASFDAHVSDVPYGLGPHQPTLEELLAYLGGAELDTGGDFMGRDWHVPSVRTWRELYRVLKPGGWTLAFAGPRTVDLVSLGMRAAGFEIRDVITFAWMFGTGFPKSQNASKAINAANLSALWEGYGTALKPAFEPIVLARKPLAGTLAENVARHGTGALAIDASRIATDWSERPESWKRSGHSAKPNAEKIAAPAGAGIDCHPGGRWPANVILDEGAAKLLDEQSGDLGLRQSGPNPGNGRGLGFGHAGRGSGTFGFGDTGGASRFFYVAKASRKERDLGCDDLPVRSAAAMTDSPEGSARLHSPRTGAGRTNGARNHHPTIKPVGLTRYLARLALPPARDGVPRRVLVPYAGSGSEMIGALLAGWDEVVGIEREADFVEILKARVGLAASNPQAFDPFAKLREDENARQVPMFDEAG